MISSLSSLSAASWVDIILLSFFALSVLFGAIHGIAGEVSRLIALLVTLSLVCVLYPLCTRFLFPDNTGYGTFLNFAIALVASALVAFLARAVTKRLVRLIVGQPLDTILGAAVRAAVSAILICLFFCLLAHIPLSSVQKTVFEKSFTGRCFRPAVEWVLRKNP